LNRETKVDIRKLLGQHDRKIFLSNPSEEEKKPESSILHWVYDSIDEFQREGTCKVLVA